MIEKRITLCITHDITGGGNLREIFTERVVVFTKTTDKYKNKKRH
ncbi:hypothetical protein Q4E40_07120 [Pontibacter sp. BT731]|nr:hypothetical protein [Pontibacter sp. BT731]MDO6389893.1 hypothetical protein [Pontibacter sp. BT731]